ncbi:DUF5407 family protein [Mycobacterium sp. RTGN5]|uniref:DUF5407 family protein n=1 Tax=Mycobacterium sp. RTGN5 TaxID=3016522 RepID=UPI0029C6A97B|nr:DUF5407 family protein [Mycobacterium sp. RTGN5]
MTAITSIKNLAASAAIAGALSVAGLGLANGIAAADPADHAGSGTSSSQGTSAKSSSPAAGATSAGPTSTVGSTPTSSVDSRAALSSAISKQGAAVKAKLGALQSNGEDLTVTDMFETQMLMNKLSQLSEMSSGVVSAMDQATMSRARAVKG